MYCGRWRVDLREGLCSVRQRMGNESCELCPQEDREAKDGPPLGKAKAREASHRGQSRGGRSRAANREARFALQSGPSR